MVRASVLSQEVVRSGARALITRSTLGVQECLKGPCAPTLELQQTGGTLGRETLRLSGDARLSPGEEVLVFLRCRAAPPARAAPLTLVGLSLGKFHLDHEGDSFRASRDLRELAFAGETPPADEVGYEELQARIRSRAGTHP